MSTARPAPPVLLWALVVVAAIYVGLAVTEATDAFWTPDSGAKFLELTTLRGDHLAWGYGGLVGSIPYPARDIDPDVQLPALPFSWGYLPGGQFQTWFPIWLAALSWLPYHLLGLRGLLFWPMAGSLASALFAGLIAERWRPGRGWLALTMAALATPLLFYSQLFWEHSLAVACVLAALYLCLASPSRAFLPALILATVAVALRREMVLAQLALIAWLAVGGFKSRASIKTLVGQLALGLAFVIAGQLLWGSRLPLGELATIRAHFAAPLPEAVSVPASAGRDPILMVRHVIGRIEAALYNSPAATAQYVQTMARWTWAAAVLAVVGGFLRAPWKWWALAMATLAAMPPVVVNLLSPDSVRSSHGIVLSVPLVLAGAALVDRGRRPAAVLLAGMMALFVAAHIAVLDEGPPSGLEWGSRIALLIYPITAVLIADAKWPDKDRVSRGLSVGSVALLVLLSVGTQIRGLRTLRGDLSTYSKVTDALQRDAPLVVITDFPFLSSSVTPVYGTDEFVYIDAKSDSRAALTYLLQQDVVRNSRLAYAGFRTPDPALASWLGPALQIGASETFNGLSVVSLRLSS